MKKIYLLLSLAFIVFNTSGQVSDVVQHINYSYCDQLYQTQIDNNSYSQFIWPMNSRATRADSAYPVKYCMVDCGNLVDCEAGTQYGNYVAQNISVDTVWLECGWENHSGQPDTLIFDIVALDAYPYNNVVHSDSIIRTTGTSYNNNFLNTNNLALPIGFLTKLNEFGVRVRFYGSKTDTFGFVAGFGEETNYICPVTGTYNAVSTNYFNSYTFYTKTNKLMPVDTASNVDSIDVWYDCDHNGTLDVGAGDGVSFIQNISMITRITINPPCTLALSAVHTNSSCSTKNGSIQLTVSGAHPPVSYLWSNGAKTQNLTGITNGVYRVTVTDFLCTQILVDTLNGPLSPTVVDSTINLTCTDTTGSIYLKVSGGLAPYSFSWNNGSTSQNVISVPADAYNITVTDKNNCSTILSDTLKSPGAPSRDSLYFTSKATTACDKGITLMEVKAVNGGAAPQYEWTLNGNSTGYTSTNYYFQPGDTGTFNISCILTSSLPCVVNSPFKVSATVTTYAPCVPVFTLSPDTLVPHLWYIYDQSTCGTGVTDTYAWNWGDGTHGTGDTATHTYANAGMYTICLILSINGICSSEYCDSATVYRTEGGGSPISIKVIPQGNNISTEANILPVKTGINIFPNPAQDYITVSATGGETIKEISITNTLGQLVYTVSTSAGNNKSIILQLPSASGLYFVHLKGAGGEYISKVVKE